jgi:hypothetical protein
MILATTWRLGEKPKQGIRETCNLLKPVGFILFSLTGGGIIPLPPIYCFSPLGMKLHNGIL